VGVCDFTPLAMSVPIASTQDFAGFARSRARAL
jgi:hypothetical protein